MQGPIDAILALMNEQELQPVQVRGIEVAVLEAGWRLVVEPRQHKYNPQSIVDAQFSMPFGAAVAVLYGAAGIDQFTEENIHSDAVRGMMGKVVMMKDARIEEKFPDEWAAHAAIELVDGRRFEKFIAYPKGDPGNPLSWDELIVKFKSLAAPVVGVERCEQLVELVRDGEWGFGAVGALTRCG
jgi:2-methylcitrate dehydratase PrpD